MSGSIYSFADLLPPTLYWDASFIVNFAYEAAMDSDFLTVPNLDVYTCAPAILQQAGAP